MLDGEDLAALSWTEIVGPDGSDFHVGTVNLERIFAQLTEMGFEVVPSDTARLGYYVQGYQFNDAWVEQVYDGAGVGVPADG